MVIVMGVAFIGIALFGVSASMPMDKNGNMSGCPFMVSATSMCPMNALEHVTYWQLLFVSVVPANAAPAFLAILAIIAYGIFRKRLASEISQAFQSIRLHHKNAPLKFFNPLLLLLSDGILHPKIYAFSR